MHDETETYGDGSAAGDSRISAGQRIDHFIIHSFLGKGGYGRVYRAWDTVLERDVALKFIPPQANLDDERRRRFVREAKAASALNHPNICTVHELRETEGQFYLVMEFIDGKTVADLLGEYGLPPQQAIDISLQVLDGLARAHDTGIIHRDIKSSNIALDSQGRVKILDFGLAKRLKIEDPSKQELTQDGITLGTLNYISPEQLMGESIGASSDLFSFGVVLYEMLNGHLPFQRENQVGTINAILHEPTPSPSDHVNPGLKQIVFKLLEKDPALRYHSAREVMTDLEALAIAEKAPNRLPRWIWIASVLLVMAAGTLIVRLLSPDTPPTIAFMRFEYEGPDEANYLAALVPSLLHEKARFWSEVQTVPLEISRSWTSPEQSQGDFTVVGRIEVAGESYRLAYNMLDRDREPVTNMTHEGKWAQLALSAADLSREISSYFGLAAPTRLSDNQGLDAYLKGKLYLEGWDLEQNLDLARSSFQTAIRQNPELAQAHADSALTLWTIYRSQREIQAINQAEAEALKALSLNPNLPEAHLALGAISFVRGKSLEAKQHFQKAQQLAPADDSVRRWLARLYRRKGLYADAESNLKAAIEIRPDYWDHHNALGKTYLVQGKYELARSSFEQVIRLNSGSHVGYVNLASVHLYQGHPEEAEPLLQKAMGIAPSAAGYSNLGFICSARGAYDEAATYYRKAIELSPHDSDLYGNLGDCYRHQGQVKLAEQAYLRAIAICEQNLSINPDNKAILPTLAMFYAALGRCQESESALAKLVTLEPHEHYYAAIAHALCQSDQAVRRHLEQAREAGLVSEIKTNPDLQPYLETP